MAQERTPAALPLTDLLFEEPGIGHCLVAPDGKVLRANAEWLRSTGYKLDDVLGANVVDLFPEMREEALAMHVRARAGHRVEVPRHARVVNGRESWWERSIAPVPMEGGTGLLISTHYVSDPAAASGRVELEESLGRERAVLASVMQATDVMLVYLDPEFNFVWVNEAYAKTCKYRPEAMVGKNHFVLYPHAENEAIFRRVRNTGEPVFFKDRAFEFPDQPERGTTYWDWSLVPVKDAQANVVGLVFSLRETTRYKRAELELDAERMRWRGVVEGIADEVWVCDANGKMSLMNLPDTTAMGLEEFEGKTVQEVLEEVEILYADGTPRPPEEAPLLRSLRSGEIVRGEEMMRHRGTGKLRYRHFSCAPTRDADGRITGAVAIVRDITERKRAEDALRDANEKLREADRRKSEFIAVLSHELRNPLAPIRNSLYLLHRAPPGSERAARAREIIERQTDHLSQLVNDLLDVTRISRGKIELHRARIDAREVVRKACEDHRALFDDGGLALHVESSDPVWIDADETRIAQVVGNLLHNAAKFGREGGSVTVQVGALDGRAEIRVRDDGLGIAPELLPRLFESFAQADGGLARTKGGLGLGLALVKGLVELHGGSIRAFSEGEGRGAEFVVKLPLAAVPERPAPCPASPAPTRARKILIIEDNVDAAESIAEALEMEGHCVHVATDGRSGMAKAHELKPEVILCDIGLPDVDGYEIARTLRAEGHGSMRLIAVSGYARPEDRQRAQEAGFDAHLAKPCSMQTLLTMLGGTDES